MSDHKTELEIEIKTYDIDVAGRVNNIVYVRWIEDLRSRLLGSRSSSVLLQPITRTEGTGHDGK